MSHPHLARQALLASVVTGISACGLAQSIVGGDDWSTSGELPVQTTTFTPIALTESEQERVADAIPGALNIQVLTADTVGHVVVTLPAVGVASYRGNEGLGLAGMGLLAPVVDALYGATAVPASAPAPLGPTGRLAELGAILSTWSIELAEERRGGLTQSIIVWSMAPGIHVPLTHDSGSPSFLPEGPVGQLERDIFAARANCTAVPTEVGGASGQVWGYDSSGALPASEAYSPEEAPALRSFSQDATTRSIIQTGSSNERIEMTQQGAERWVRTIQENGDPPEPSGFQVEREGRIVEDKGYEYHYTVLWDDDDWTELHHQDPYAEQTGPPNSVTKRTVTRSADGVLLRVGTERDGVTEGTVYGPEGREWFRAGIDEYGRSNARWTQWSCSSAAAWTHQVDTKPRSLERMIGPFTSYTGTRITASDRCFMGVGYHSDHSTPGYIAPGTCSEDVVQRAREVLIDNAIGGWRAYAVGPEGTSSIHGEAYIVDRRDDRPRPIITTDKVDTATVCRVRPIVDSGRVVMFDAPADCPVPLIEELGSQWLGTEWPTESIAGLALPFAPVAWDQRFEPASEDAGEAVRYGTRPNALDTVEHAQPANRPNDLSCPVSVVVDPEGWPIAATHLCWASDALYPPASAVTVDRPASIIRGADPLHQVYTWRFNGTGETRRVVVNSPSTVQSPAVPISASVELPDPTVFPEPLGNVPPAEALLHTATLHPSGVMLRTTYPGASGWHLTADAETAGQAVAAAAGAIATRVYITGGDGQRTPLLRTSGTDESRFAERWTADEGATFVAFWMVSSEDRVEPPVLYEPQAGQTTADLMTASFDYLVVPERPVRLLRYPQRERDPVAVADAAVRLRPALEWPASQAVAQKDPTRCDVEVTFSAVSGLVTQARALDCALAEWSTAYVRRWRFEPVPIPGNYSKAVTTVTVDWSQAASTR